MWALAGLWLLTVLAELGLLVAPGGGEFASKLRIVYLVLPFGYAVVLLTLQGWNSRYRLAAACALAAALMGVGLEFTDAFSTRTALAVKVAFYFMGALAEYFECGTHGRVFAFINHGLRRAWGRVWTWYIWTLAAVLLCAVLSSLVSEAAGILELVSGIALLAQRSGKLCVLAASARELGRHRRT